MEDLIERSIMGAVRLNSYAINEESGPERITEYITNTDCGLFGLIFIEKLKNYDMGGAELERIIS